MEGCAALELSMAFQLAGSSAKFSGSNISRIRNIKGPSLPNQLPDAGACVAKSGAYEQQQVGARQVIPALARAKL